MARGIGLDPRIGPGYLKAGVGFGGSCLPKDTRALLWLASRVGLRLPVLEGALEVNRRQRRELVEKLESVLGGLEDRVVGVLGLAFKPHTDDVRESPALEVISCLVARGARVRAYDPKAMENARMWLAGLAAGVREKVSLCASVTEVAEGADALLLLTEWPEFATLDWEDIRRRVSRPYLFDGRNFLEPGEMRRLGFFYRGVGRGIPDVPDDVSSEAELPAAGTGAGEGGRR